MVDNSCTSGFETMQQSALDVLSDLLLRYIGEIGSTTRSYSELGHRMTPTSDDLVLAAMCPLLLCVQCQTHSGRQCGSTSVATQSFDIACGRHAAILCTSMQPSAIAQLMAFKELGIKVDDIVAYTNEQVWSTPLARHLR
jgi:Bromodomain associated